MTEPVGAGTLRVTTPDGEVVVGDQPTVTIGRVVTADVRVDHALVSRVHAVMERRTDGWWVEDRSKNGVFLDGQRVASAFVGAGVTLHLGAADGPWVALAPLPSAAWPSAAGPAAPAQDGSPAAVFRLPSSGVIRIGRAPDNHIVVDDLLVSRYHAELRPDGPGAVELVDLGSHNGTFVNGRAARRARLEDLDVVGIGHHLFRSVGGVLEEYVDTGEVSFEAARLSVRTDAGQVLLDDVSFSLERRGLLAVVGPSGAGKSTLLHALTGFRPADVGGVFYDGRNLYAEYEELRRRIGFVPQDDILHSQLTVRRALEFSAELRFPPDVSEADRLSRVAQVMDELGLTERADLPISRLSGGQRKRTSVAVELLTAPSLLFLDEPTSGLDPGYERSLMKLLRDLADGGRTVVVVTHSVQSLRLCDRVLVLAPGGRTAYFGPAQTAPAYFGRDDFQEVFQDLSAEPGFDWKGRFAASADYEDYVAKPLSRRPVAEQGGWSTPPPIRQHEGLRQFVTLSHRYVQVLVSDRRNLPLLLLQAPLLGLIMLYALPGHELGPPRAGQFRLLSQAGVVLFEVVLAGTWLGLSNAVREIVKERAIFERERAVGMSMWAYVGSKAAVLGTLTVLQAAVLTFLALARQGGPTSATALGWPLGEMIAGVAAAGLASMALGLLVSALVSSADMAMTLLPVLLVLQNVLALGGVFPEVVHRPVLQQMSYVASAQYGFASVASTADLNRLQAITNVVRNVKSVDVANPQALLRALAKSGTTDPRLAHRPAIWAANMGALAGLTIAGLALTGIVLSRRRTT